MPSTDTILKLAPCRLDFHNKDTMLEELRMWQTGFEKAKATSRRNQFGIPSGPWNSWMMMRNNLLNTPNGSTYRTDTSRLQFWQRTPVERALVSPATSDSMIHYKRSANSSVTQSQPYCLLKTTVEALLLDPQASYRVTSFAGWTYAGFARVWHRIADKALWTAGWPDSAVNCIGRDFRWSIHIAYGGLIDRTCWWSGICRFKWW